MKSTSAVVHSAKAPFVFEEVDLPEPGPHEVLVRIAGVGICHTDLASRDGLLGAPFPSIFGHEGAGYVERIGSEVKRVAVGDHVVLAPSSDGSCPLCQMGQPMYCDHFNELNFQTDKAGPAAALKEGGRAYLKYFGQSSMGQYSLTNERNAVLVDSAAPLSILGPLGCGIQTGAGTVINGMRPQAGSSIAVIGTGAVGLAAVLGAVVCGCAVIIAIDRVPSRLELAQSLGATHAINTAAAKDLTAAIRAIVPRGVDFVIDSAGVPGLIEPTLGAMARLGTFGLVAVPPTVDRKLEIPWFSVLLQGQRIQGFTEGNAIPDIFIPQMVQLQREGKFPFDKLIQRYPFERINDAVEDQRTGKTIKAVLEFPIK